MKRFLWWEKRYMSMLFFKDDMGYVTFFYFALPGKEPGYIEMACDVIKRELPSLKFVNVVWLYTEWCRKTDSRPQDILTEKSQNIDHGGNINVGWGNTVVYQVNTEKNMPCLSAGKQ